MKAAFPKQHRYRKPLRELIIESLGDKCSFCDNTFPLVLDHRIALSEGGEDKIENLQVLCEYCHKVKHNGGSLDGVINEVIAFIEE